MGKTAARTLMRKAFAQARTETAYARSIGPANFLFSQDVARAGIVTAPYSTRATCRCSQRPRLASAVPTSPLDLPHGLRAFHASATVNSRGGKKKESKHQAAAAAAATATAPAAGDAGDGSKHPQPSATEPLNFADVEARIAKHSEHFKAALKKVNSSGRFDPDVVGALRVVVDKKEGTSYPLSELAQVVPRGGRTMSLLVHDAEYVKPIMSAVQASPDFNQQPQRDADNELELILKLEADKQDDVAKRVKAIAHDWRERIQAVRQKRDKLHDTWKKTGDVGPDLKRTADKELQKVIKDALAEVDNVEKATAKTLKP